MDKKPTQYKPDDFYRARKNNHDNKIALGFIFRANPYALKEMHPVYRQAYEKAVDLVQFSRINMLDFNYADLAQDVDLVKKRIEGLASLSKNQAEENHGVESAVLEAMLYDLIKNKQWFGRDTLAVLPSVYDDLERGTDLILEHLSGDHKSYSGIGIDITTGDVAIQKKFEETLNRLKRKGLDSVKYFKSPDGNYKGELNNIPHLILGFDRETLFKVTQDWVNPNPNFKSMPYRKGLLDLLIFQCDAFSNATTNPEVISAYQREKRILENILKTLK